MNFKFNRRHLLKSLIALPCAMGGYWAYRKIKKGDGTVRTIGAKQVPAQNPIEIGPTTDSLSFLAVGDTGLASTQRNQVIDRMKRSINQKNIEQVFLLGDNFYDRGVASVNDAQWNRDFETPFDLATFPMPFYACLGNHDYFGNIGAQIEYSRINRVGICRQLTIRLLATLALIAPPTFRY